MSRWRSMAALGLFVALMMAFGFWYSYQKSQASPDVPIKATITIYTDLPNNLTSFIADKYQVERQVRVKIMPLTGAQMARRMNPNYLDQEGDIILTSKDNLVLGAKGHHLLGMYSETIDLVPPQFKDDNGAWVGTWYDPILFTQNTQYYNHLGQFITTWSTLAKPGPWTVVMTDYMAAESAANIFYSFVETEGEEGALNYMKALEEHITQHAKYLDTPIRLASLNEVNVGIGNYSDGQAYAKQGYPVKLIFPQDGTPYYLTGVGVLKSTQQYEESVNFVNWLLAKQTNLDMAVNGYAFVFTNPEVADPVDSLGHGLVLFNTQGGYTVEGKKQLLDTWLKQVRFSH